MSFLKTTIFSKKIFLKQSVLYIFFLLFFIFPQKSEATGIPTFDFSNLIQNTIQAISAPTTAGSSVVTAGAQTAQVGKEFILDGVANAIAKTIIKRITAQTVNWINSGFKGNPAFVTDPGQFFLNIGDNMASKILSDPGSPLNQLCSPFRAKIRLALVKNYLNEDNQNFACTIDTVKNNYNAFVNDFDRGGWDSWFEVTQQNQNNPYGAYMESKILLSTQIGNARSQQKEILNQSGGFLSYEKCVEKAVPLVDETGIDFGAVDRGLGTDDCLKKETVTPGSVVNKQLENVLGSGVRQLELTNEINQVVGALMMQMIEKVVGGAQDGLRGLSRGSNNQQTFIQQIQNQSQAEESNTINNAKNFGDPDFKVDSTTGQTKFTGDTPDIPTEKEVEAEVKNKYPETGSNSTVQLNPDGSTTIISSSTPIATSTATTNP